MRIAFSSCPNDTFVFHALVHGLVPGAPEMVVSQADIDVTNTTAGRGEYDLVKVSYAALPGLLTDYALLPCGGALGRGCGPLVLSRGKRATAPPAEWLVGATVAIPSEQSTAYLLFRQWSAEFRPARTVILPFHEIMPAVAAGRVDAGLVIHEARFTYRRYGLTSVADLGEWWESETGLPIPLGAIIARRSLDHQALASWIRASVRHAWAHPEQSRAYVLAHAQEMDLDVVDQHIALYVNEFTENLGDDGMHAVEVLLDLPADRLLAGAVVPPPGP
jgi:1,4-dihydroxy-6-naphthoate synthase